MSHNTHSRHVKKAILPSLALVLAVFTMSSAWSGPAPEGYEAIDPPLPVPTVPYYDADGTPQFLESQKGRLLVVNFWATWCAPCVAEMPALDRLQARATAEDLPITVLALSIDRQGAPLVKKFYATNKINNLPVAIDRKSAIGKEMGVRNIPTTIIIDAKGRQIGRMLGVHEWDGDQMMTFLKTLAPSDIKEARADGPQPAED